MDTLINISGGIDSVYIAYEWLKNNKKDKILLHHINLISREGIIRHKVEKRAVNEVLNYFNNNGMNNYKYIESVFDYHKFGYTVRDVDIVMFMSGVLLHSKQCKSIKKILVPNNANDFTRAQYDDLNIKRFNIFRSISPRNVEFLFPIKHLTKAEIIELLPKELFKMCWFCRKPLEDMTPCKKCRTCKEVGNT